LIFLSPLILLLLSLGAMPVLILGSLGLWTVRGQNFYLAIQPLYLFGLMVGFYFEQIKRLWFGWAVTRRHKVRQMLYGCFLLSLLLSVFFVFFFDDLAKYLPMTDYLVAKNRVLNWYFDKNTVGLGRLILAPIWFLAGACFFFDQINFIKNFRVSNLAFNCSINSSFLSLGR